MGGEGTDESVRADSGIVVLFLPGPTGRWKRCELPWRRGKILRKYASEAGAPGILSRQQAKLWVEHAGAYITVKGSHVLAPGDVVKFLRG